MIIFVIQVLSYILEKINGRIIMKKYQHISIKIVPVYVFDKDKRVNYVTKDNLNNKNQLKFKY